MVRIEHFYEKISILRKKYLINERYTCGKIGVHGIQSEAKLAHTCCVSGRW